MIPSATGAQPLKIGRQISTAASVGSPHQRISRQNSIQGAGSSTQVQTFSIPQSIDLKIDQHQGLPQPFTGQSVNLSPATSAVGGGLQQTSSSYQQAAMILAHKSKEAQPILRRERHLSKIVTIYVVDKYNFNLQKLQRLKQSIRESKDKSELESQQEEKKAGNLMSDSQDSIIDQNIQSEEQHLNSETERNAQKIDMSFQTESMLTSGVPISLKLPQLARLSRGSSAPLKGKHPTHFNHGERAHKYCLVCDGYAKPNSGQGSGPKDTGQGLKEHQLKDLKHAVGGHEGNRGHDIDLASERKLSMKKEDSVRYHGGYEGFGTGLSTKPTYSVDGGNSVAGNSPRNKKANQSPESKKENQELKDPKKNESTIHEEGAGATDVQPTTEPQNFQNPSSPTKRDGDIEEFQKRRILLDDFLQGAPDLKLMFSKHVRKFNRELLKATCLVIGCRRIYANKISEKVFDEFDQILNNLSDSIEFDQHFDLNRENDISIEKKDGGKKHIITVTISAPLFKFVLKKYLVEKYKYSRPEYLKDFYVASDLVQSKRNILILLAGTSGTGKSTLASLLGSRLGISTVLSTDTIRHVMRNFVAKEDDPIIFASTYETAAFVTEDVQSKKKRTLMGYKDQCYKVQTELEKVIDDFQRRNESLVVEGVHLTVRFMLNMMKKYPSCIPFVICITNEDKHKERFAVRTKHMTIDPKFNKYIKNVASIRIIQKHIIKKAEAALIPRIDNSNIDKSIGLIHATIVRCLRQIAEGTPIFDPQRKQAMIMHQEFANISKNKLSSKDAQKFIHQKVNKKEILDNYLKQQANTELEDKLKRYKRGQSMGQMTTGKGKGPNKNSDSQLSEAKSSEINLSNQIHSEKQANPLILEMMNNLAVSQVDLCSDDRSPKAKTIHVIMRPDPEGFSKLSEIERKNIKKQFLNVFQEFPEDEETFGDSKAAQLVAASGSKLPNSKPKTKKEKPQDEEESRIRDEKKRQSDQQKKIEEEKIQSAILEAQKKEKEELEKIEAETKLEKDKLEKEKIEKEQQEKLQEIHERIQAQLALAPKSQSLIITGSQLQASEDHVQEIQGKNLNKSFEYLNEEEEAYEIPLVRKQSSIGEEQKSSKHTQNSSPQSLAPINITNVKELIKKETQLNQAPIIVTVVEDFFTEPKDQVKKNSSKDGSVEDRDDDNESNRAQPESRSMTSLEHLKQMESLDEFVSKRSETVLSDFPPDDEEMDHNMREMNVTSAGVIQDQLSPKKENYLTFENQNHDSALQYKSESNANEDINPSKSIQKSKFKKQRQKEDVKSVEPPIQFLQHPGLSLVNMNKSTERSAGNDSSEGNSNEAQNIEAKPKNQVRLEGAAEKKASTNKQGVGNSMGLRAFKSVTKHKVSKLKTQSSASLIKRVHKKNMPFAGTLGSQYLQVPGTLGTQALQSTEPKLVGKQDNMSSSKLLKTGGADGTGNQDDLQSIYSGGSGMAPSLVSGSINFFPQGNAVKTDEDNQSAANPGDKLQESGESSDDMNSQDAEASDRDVISEEEDVIMSHSSDTDHEEDHEDEMDKKQTSFNHPKVQPQSQTQQQQSSVPHIHLSPPKADGIFKEDSQEKAPSGDSTTAALIHSLAEHGSSSAANEAYDQMKPVSKKSFEEDNTNRDQQKQQV